MSGPGLRKKESHKMIHYAVQGEIEEALAILDAHDSNTEAINKMATETLESLWNDKVLAHAQEEEDGLYRDLLKADPGINGILQRLSRDHDLLRKLTFEETVLVRSTMDYHQISMLSHTMLNILKIHSKEEIEVLEHLETRIEGTG